ncbi:MAG TPA: zinc finger Ran-binding domain-containing protein [Gemmatimonadales bacterium]|nr:zinc finger Ran-binding domain-containing protein [Gemmatimonadales bacterium]
MPMDTDNSIEALLEQRAQFEQWLAKLDATADKAPPAVRQKVRADYQARLQGVIERLRGHAATIADELHRHQATQGELDTQRRQAEEELAEAEVRHAVGEFGDDEWRRISGESDNRLSGLREQLKTVGREIARLVEVQGLIAAPSRGAEPAPAAARAPVVEEEIERSPPPPVEPMAAPAPPPKPSGKPAPRAREHEHSGAQADELAFLKSVADEDVKPAAPRRPSNPGPAAAQASRAVETAPAPGGGSKSGAPGVAKTLKCGECGTLNRPTEWYCERCGAELAGV